MRRLPLLALVVVMACSDEGGTRGPERSLATLRMASLSIRHGDATLDVSAEAWRSFQPTPDRDADDAPLLVLARLRSTGAPIPASLALDGIYLLHDGEVTAVRAREEQPREREARFAEFMVRDAPGWPPGDSVDVILALKDHRASTLLLRAPRVGITRVD